MIHFDFDGKPMLYYHDKKNIRYACDWFWGKTASPPETANLLKKLYQYDDLIIIMAYTMFLENIRPNEINFNNLIERKIFINPFQTT